MIDRAALQVAADGHTNHQRALPFIARAPSEQCQFVANLVHGGPDVVEELDLGYRFQSACGHADGPADNVGFGERRIEHPRTAELALQIGSNFEDAALPLDLVETLL